MNEAQDIIIQSKEDVMINLTAHRLPNAFYGKCKDIQPIILINGAWLTNITASIKLNADRSMNAALDINIVTKVGVLTGLTSLSPSNCIPSIK